ncbi:hypothetical protein LSH36_100g02026 [Paralvinella palmiformis]|uniref:Zinc-hook domain-containing protein n=1 Tax=Paralvinella palmiformis TaxID=53620 RepID=A0AAD9JZV9_9ANNE|nr:hypothetical protein LSH36_100g02026 [Paralvinella palmiformis]
MSCIEKMVIQGIRSFGPSNEDKQMITFFTPLTLILGPNGTGKTTIIECLKYITTGDMPPGAAKNAAFIHDPKVIDETEVNAQIRLKFRNVQGQIYLVTRSIKAIQKAKNIQLKTLEGVITRKDPVTGQNTSISSKCAEMDKEMVTLLGVAKPILDSVIFCHQEDSNWPLSEGKALKCRFDDIFASTRYVKALECLRKTAKDQDIEIKLYQSEIKYLKQNRDKANQLKADLDEKTSQHEAAKEIINDIGKKMKPVISQLDKLKLRGHEIYEIQTKIEKMKTEQKQIEKSQKELKANIKNIFQGSVTDLKQAIRNFEIELRRKEAKLEQHKCDVNNLVDKLEMISDEKAALLVELGLLKEDAQRFQKNIQNRNVLVMGLKAKYDITGFTGTLSDKQAAEFVKILHRKQQEVKEDLQRKRLDYEKKEADIQNEIDELRRSQTKLETELSMKNETRVMNRNEIKDIMKKLYTMEASPEYLKQISTELKRLEKELKMTEDKLDTDSLRTEIKELTSEKGCLDSKLKRLDEELNQLTRESSVRSRLTHLENDKTTKLETCQKLKASAADSLTHLLGHVPTEHLRKHLDQCLGKLNKLRRKASEHLQKLKREKTEKETQHKMVREQLRKKEEEIHDYQDQLSAVSGSENFDDGLEKLQVDLKKAQDEKGNLKGVQYMYKKYQETLGREDPPCPLCHRPFDNQNEVEELIAELEKKMSLVPDKLERVCSKIDKNKKKVEDLIQLKPIRTAKEDEVDALTNDEQMAQNIQGDVYMIDKLHTEIQMLEKEIKQLSSKLSTTVLPIPKHTWEAKIELHPLCGNIKEKEKEKQELTHSKEMENDERSRQLNKIIEETQNVIQCNRDIERYIQEGKDKHIEQKEAEIKKSEERAFDINEEKAEFESEIDKMKDDLSKQELRKREMSDNLALWEKEADLKILKQNVLELDEQLGGLDVDNLNVQQDMYEAEYDKYRKEKLQAETRKNRFEEAINIIEKELKGVIYKDADKKYREKMIDLTTTDQAKQDLMKYYKALDRTIMNYHQSKMAEINKIIRQLWVNTYKGNDIETIEIRSDEEEGIGGANRRRTFNYRVVMIKNGVAIDMRNRCSAGQKWLLTTGQGSSRRPSLSVESSC